MLIGEQKRFLVSDNVLLLNRNWINIMSGDFRENARVINDVDIHDEIVTNLT